MSSWRSAFLQAGVRVARSPRALPVTAVALGAMLRSGWALLVPVVPVSDAEAYDILARSLAAGQGYSWHDGSLTAYWPPGTSFVYAGLYRVFGGSYHAVVVFQVLVGVAILCLAWRLAAYAFGRRTAALAVLFLALWPLLIQFTTVPASEILFMAPVTAAVVLTYAAKNSGIFHWIGFGLLIGIAVYIRPTALPLVVLLPVGAALRYGRYRSLPAWILVGGLTCTLLLSPWVIRNTRLYGEFTAVSTNFGPNLWMGNNQSSSGVYQPLETDLEFEDERARDVYYRRRAMDFIRGDPLRFLKLALRRAAATFDRETIGIVWNIEGLRRGVNAGPGLIAALKVMSSAYWYTILLLACAGLMLIARNERLKALTHPMVLTTVFFVLIPLITVGQDRYHMPMIPFVAAIAAHAVVRIQNVKLPSRSGTGRSAVSARTSHVE